MAKILLKKTYEPEDWNRYWERKVNLRGRCRVVLQEVKVTKLSIIGCMLMHLTKVWSFVIIDAWHGQLFRERCGSSGGNSRPTPPAWSIWRRAGGRMDSCVRTVGARSIG